MDDKMIVRLYFERNEQAITETSEKYGHYCHHIAHNILFNNSDEEECVNDTWLHAWNCIPPNEPTVLSVFLGKITRNLCFDYYKRKHSQKRGGHNIDLVLDELEELVSGNDNPEEMLNRKELIEEINKFLQTLPEEKRYIFISRYWYTESVSDIAKCFGYSEGNVSVTLNRIRNKLKAYLAERGYNL